MGDILILLILIIMTYLGYKKGFLRTLTGVISIILSFVLALTFSPQVETFIKSTPVYENIYQNVEKNVAPSSQNEDEYNTSNLNMPQQMIKDIKQGAENAKNEALSTVTQKICDVSVKIVSIILIFLAVRILMMLLLSGFGIIKKLPFIGWFDRILGALFGFIRGFLVVYLLLVLVTAFTAFNVDNPLVKSINHSEFAKVMYNNNVFLDFVSKD